MSAESRPGWLADQLPRPLAEDEFTRRLLGIFEEIAGSFRERADGFADQLDPRIASPEFLRWTAGWLGLQLDAGLEESRQRAVVRAAGALFPWRGTPYGLHGILAAMTDGAVTVEDGGGVFKKGKATLNNHTVAVTLATTAGLNEQRLLEMIGDEVPADAAVVLRVGKRTVRPEEQADQSDDAPKDPEAAGDDS